MKNFLKMALLPLFIFTACDKYPDEVIVTINESGFVIIKAIDNDNQPVKDAEIQIYSSGRIIWEGFTDDSGIYVSEKMLQGSYYCIISFTKRKLVYQDRKEIQVIAGETQTITVNPFANSGNLNIQLESPNKLPIPDLNVLILPRDFYSNSIDEYIAETNFQGKVDAQKKMHFVEIPTGSYRAVIYDDDKKTYTTYNSDSYIQIERGKTKDYTIRVDLR